MKTSTRLCAICDSEQAQHLYKQHFQSIGDATLMHGYDVVSCVGCGFVYADNIPSKEVFDRYYAESSKYEFSHNQGQQHAAELDRLQNLAVWVASILPCSVKLIDIGCATGELLLQLRERGFKNLKGLDPSAICVEYARSHHQLEVIQGVLGPKPAEVEHFDGLILSAVLEHIPELSLCVEHLKSWIKTEGVVILEVPDAEFYADGFNAPFQEFSVEHINFFTASSLNNLMQKHGFCKVAERHYVGHTGNNTTSPVLTMIFRAGNESISPSYEMQSVIGVKKYLEKCQAWAQYEKATINKLLLDQQPILVWGTGTLCQRLLATTDFHQANIVAFVDSNPHYQGKQFHQKPVIAPNLVNNYPQAILITSWSFQQEITKQIRETLLLPNEIISLMPERLVE